MSLNLYHLNDAGNSGQKVKIKIHPGLLTIWSPRVPEDSYMKPLGSATFTN